MKTLREMIDRGVEIVAEIEKLKEEYKALEEGIKAAALARPGEHVKLEDPEREGRQFLAAGTQQVVPVVMTADSIMKTLRKGSPIALRLADMAGEHFERFYVDPAKLENTQEDGKDFRRLSRELLGDEKGPRFVNACLTRLKNGTPQSSVRIEWKRAAAAAKLEEVARG